LEQHESEWGHLVIKMSGHSPFSAQVILNGHNFVELHAKQGGIGFQEEGNCFTRVDDPARLALCALVLSRPAARGRLRQVCERWVYSSVLCHRHPRLGPIAGDVTGRVRRPSPWSALVCKAAATRIVARQNPERDWQDSTLVLSMVPCVTS
jgi:hypothetical protein